MLRDSKQLQIGKAGEYLVCADVILKGLVGYLSEQGLAYDVVIDTGKRLLKVQVKTTEKVRIILQRKSKIPAYIFSVKRAGKNKKTKYTESEIDLFALVCLDTMKIGYVKNKDMPETINIRSDEFMGSYYDERGMRDFNLVRELNKTIKNQSEISRKTGIHVSIVNRYLKNGYKPFETKARYFSDFIRNKEWFYDI